MRHERALVGIAHLDREVAHVRRALGQQLEQAQEGRVVALHRADLQDAPRGVARGGDAIALLERERQRLLAEHVQAGLQALAGDVGVKRVRHRHDDRVQPQAEQAVERGVALGDAVAVADGSPHHGRRIGQGDEVEALAVVPQEVGVRGLADEAGAHQPDAQPTPARTHEPSLERCNSVRTITAEAVALHGWH